MLSWCPEQETPDSPSPRPVAAFCALLPLIWVSCEYPSHVGSDANSESTRQRGYAMQPTSRDLSAWARCRRDPLSSVSPSMRRFVDRVQRIRSHAPIDQIDNMPGMETRLLEYFVAV